MSLFSTGFFQEKVVKNGKVVTDINMNSVVKRDNNRTKYIVQGKKNNKPFIITNMTRVQSKKTRKSKTAKRKTRGKK